MPCSTTSADRCALPSPRRRVFFLIILLASLFADGYGPGAARGPRLVRGGARADHARADRSRARQVCRALLYPHAVAQGIYLACHTHLPALADNGDRCLRLRSMRDTLWPRLRCRRSYPRRNWIMQNGARSSVVDQRKRGGDLSWGWQIQVLSVDRESLSCVCPAGFTSPSTGARR